MEIISGKVDPDLAINFFLIVFNRSFLSFLCTADFMQFTLHCNFMQGLIVNTILFDLNLAAFSIYYDFQKRHTNAYM